MFDPVTISIRGGRSTVGGVDLLTATTIMDKVLAVPDPQAKRKVIEYDRNMFAEDSRRIEPKKYKGPKARARFQKSYR